jgi:cytochrome c peroxidase
MKSILSRTRRMAVAGVAALGTLALLSGLAFGAIDPWKLSGSGRWSVEDLAVLASMMLERLPGQPRDASNAVENNPQAAALGKRLFSDTRFSRDRSVSCASCHVPDKQFQDGVALARGIGVGTRRTMPIAGAGHSPWLFWDGRKDSLWSQALGPMEDAAEHGGNRTRIAHLLREHYRQDYEAVFGALPELAGLPADAGPLGTDEERRAWDRMEGSMRASVNRVFANMGKAIAAYERTLTPGESRFDRYVRAALNGDAEGQRVLDAREVNGLRLFIGKAQCATCHSGPLLSDHAFHNTGVPPLDPRRPERGRSDAVSQVRADEFNCLGPYSDARPEQCAELRFIAHDDPAILGAFRTPGLRNVAQRAPYMHAGQLASLEDVVSHYVSAPAAAVGHSELVQHGAVQAQRRPIRLSSQEIADLVRFLGTLSAPIIEAPAP